MSMQGFMENVQAFVDTVSENLDRTSEKIRGKDPGFAALPKDKTQILIYFSPNNVSPEIASTYANLKRKGKGVTSTNIRFWNNEFKKLLKSGTLAGFTKAAIKYFGEENLEKAKINISSEDSEEIESEFNANPTITGQDIKKFFSLLQGKDKKTRRFISSYVLPKIQTDDGSFEDMSAIYDKNKGILNRNIAEVIGTGAIQEASAKEQLDKLVSRNRSTVNQFYLEFKRRKVEDEIGQMVPAHPEFTAKTFDDLNREQKELILREYELVTEEGQQQERGSKGLTAQSKITGILNKDNRLYKEISPLFRELNFSPDFEAEDYILVNRPQLKKVIMNSDIPLKKVKARSVDRIPDAYPNLSEILRQTPSIISIRDDELVVGGSLYRPSDNLKREGGLKLLKDLISAVIHYNENEELTERLNELVVPDSEEALSGEDPDSETEDADSLPEEIEQLAKVLIKEVTEFKNKVISAFQDKIDDIARRPDKYSELLENSAALATLKETNFLV